MSTKIKIEKGVPMPFISPTIKNVEVYAAIKAMNIGDSVVIKKTSQYAWRMAAKILGVKIAIRSTSEVNCRLWVMAKNKIIESNPSSIAEWKARLVK